MYISTNEYEHLLNCLANQKFNPSEEDQKEIDEVWNNGMKKLAVEKHYEQNAPIPLLGSKIN